MFVSTRSTRQTELAVPRRVLLWFVVLAVGTVVPQAGFSPARAADDPPGPERRALQSLERYRNVLETTLDSLQNLPAKTRDRVSDLRGSAKSLVDRVRESRESPREIAYQKRIIGIRNRLQAQQAALQQDLLELKLRALREEGRRVEEGTDRERSDFEKIMGILLEKPAEQPERDRPTPGMEPETYETVVDRVHLVLQWMTDQARYVGELRGSGDARRRFELTVRRAHRHFILYLEAYFQDRALTDPHAKNYLQSLGAFSDQADRGQLTREDRAVLFRILKLQERMLDTLASDDSERLRTMTATVWRLLSVLQQQPRGK